MEIINISFGINEVVYACTGYFTVIGGVTRYGMLQGALLQQGRPVWAGVTGFPAQFVSEEIDNAVVFAPGDVGAAVAAVDRLALHCRPRSAFIEKWRRNRIMDDMASEVLALVTDEI